MLALLVRFAPLFSFAVVAFLIFAPGSAGSTDSTPLNWSNKLNHFLEEHAAHYPGDATFTINPDQLAQLESCTNSRLFLSGAQELRSRSTIGVQCFAPSQWTRYVQAHVQINGSYVVAAETLNPSTIITSDKLLAREGDLLKIGRGVLLTADELLGRITTQRIAKHRPIKAQAVRSANSIERGKQVQIEARGRGFTVTTDGVAVRGGEPGAQIPVRTRSGQVVTGSVVDANTVLILM